MKCYYVKYTVPDNRKTSSNQNGSLRLNASKGTCSPKQDMTGDKNFVVVALRKGKRIEKKKKKCSEKPAERVLFTEIYVILRNEILICTAGDNFS